ncbi:MAG TPA: hypothetical protein VML55_11980 [Planctomycetaceae bacterium]|nr:hypothetical protein [Planctomycetaceae bacterium]
MVAQNPRRRLPPKVLGNSSRQRTKQPPRKPWYRHAPWVLPTLVCVVFAVLIAGVAGVRQVIVLVQGTAGADAPETPARGSADEDAAGGLDGSFVDADDGRVSLASNEPGLEVLPPAAAGQPGRKLPRLLLVGRHPQMFKSVSESVAVAVPGDVIEIRTNGPLLESGAELKLERREPGKGLTIRAGQGFQPVLRPDQPQRTIVRLTNSDLTLSGLHVTSAVPCRLASVENGNVVIEHCSVTSIPPRGGVHVLAVKNTSELPLNVVIDRCLTRGRPQFSFAGPAIQLTLRESAFVGGQHLLVMAAAEDQSLTIQNCTFINCYLLTWPVDAGWPQKPLSVRMEGSLFALLSCCATLFDVRVPKSDSLADPDDYRDALRRALREFRARDNVAQFWEGWAAVSQGGNLGRFIREPVFGDEHPPIDDTLRFGSRIEQVRSMIHKQGNPPETAAVIASVVPQDLVPVSQGILAERVALGRRYGCDVARLPVPPASTLP